MSSTPVEPFNHDSNKGGGSYTVLQMTFPKGVILLCTQGKGGEYSHDEVCTFYDLDFDTSNTERWELYAPVSGTVHVHTEAETGSGFGNHINIDIGNSYYVVIGHLDEILVCDGCEVTVGQLIGIEGCTGLCTGDHVHVGLHKGDAKLPAENGESISTTYVISDSLGEEKTLTSGQFVCGLGSGKKDDPEPVGKYYQSALPVAYGHPDGTIVKTAQDPKVYLIENGELRWFKNEEVFWSHGYDFSNLDIISDEELECYQMGISFSEKGLVAAFRDPIGTLWLVVGATNQWDRYRIKVADVGWEAVLRSWGLSYTSVKPPPKVEWWNPYLSQWGEKNGR
ncbi:MAG: M23 family metallopeptidase, partial [Bacteroidota bacterium]